MKKGKHLFYLLSLIIITCLYSLNVQADNNKMYAVTITNLTQGETFTPIFVASHKKGFPLFELGSPASSELISIAEGGDIQPMSDALTNNGMAFDVSTNGALLAPGESTTVTVKTKGNYRHISVAAMLIPTNDGFIALNGVRGPKNGTKVFLSPTYDAGSETNDELCANIPGPACGGSPFSPDDAGEGYVHIHPGIHGRGDLDSAIYDWRNPTAKISIKLMK